MGDFGSFSQGENTQPDSAETISSLLTEARRRLDAYDLSAPGGSVGTVGDLTEWGLVKTLVGAVEIGQAENNRLRAENRDLKAAGANSPSPTPAGYPEGMDP